MKRLVIILAVLVMGIGFSTWCCDLHAADDIKSVETVENPADSPKTEGAVDVAVADANSPDAPAKDSQEKADGNEGDAKGDGKRKLKEGEDPNDPFVAINLNNIEMSKILTKLAAWTDKVIIPSDEAMKVKITIYAAKEVPQSEALSLIYDALRAKGIIAEISENKMYLKPIAQAKLGYIPVLSADEPLARVKDKSQMVEKYFRLKNSSPSKLVGVITPLTASYGHVTAYESARSIAVIDTVENLFRIEKTIALFDVPESDQIVEKVFEIKNGDASEIVQVFELIYQKTKGSSKSRPTPKPPTPAKGTSTPATSVIIEAGEIPIVLLPIPKHNWIIARASAEDMENITIWVKKLDIAESVPQEQTVIGVVYVDPMEVVRLVKNTIQNMPGSELRTSVVVEAMRNSKQIVVFGSEENRKLVERLIAEIDLPVDDIYVSKVIKLKHIDSDEVKENIEALYENQAGNFSSSTYGRSGYSRMSKNIKPEDVVKVTSFPALKQVSIIATEENLKEIIEQVKEWDVPMDLKENQYRLITLKNSDPVQMVELLSTLFSEDGEGGSSMNFMRMIFGGRDDMETKKKIVGSLYGLLTFESVPGTKKILVISKVPEAYSVIEALVKDLDSQERGEAPKVITLNYADPEELCDQLNAILNERGTNATLKRRQQGLSLTGYKSSDDGSSQDNSDQQVETESITPWWDSGRTDDTEMPLSNLIGKIRFIPVHRSKAILVIAPPEYYEDIEELVGKLDKPEMQVMIEAVIVEVDHSSMTSLGVELSSNPGAFGDIGQNAITALANITYNKQFSSGIAFSSGTGTNINVLIDLLAKTVNAKVLNQPTLWTKDNEEAVFFKGREISIQTGSQISSNGAQESYDLTPVGVTLRIRPNITPERDVDITINLEISDLASETVNGQPVINKLNTLTNLIIADGETIMLGGILFQTESDINSKIPLLGDLPLIGGFFSHKNKVMRNTELLIFLTPHVVTGKESVASEKYIIPSEEKIVVPPIEKIESLRTPGLNTDYIKSPAQRMREIKEGLDSALMKEMINGKK